MRIEQFKRLSPLTSNRMEVFKAYLQVAETYEDFKQAQQMCEYLLGQSEHDDAPGALLEAEKFIEGSLATFVDNGDTSDVSDNEIDESAPIVTVGMLRGIEREFLEWLVEMMKWFNYDSDENYACLNTFVETLDNAGYRSVDFTRLVSLWDRESRNRERYYWGESNSYRGAFRGRCGLRYHTPRTTLRDTSRTRCQSQGRTGKGRQSKSKTDSKTPEKSVRTPGFYNGV